MRHLIAAMILFHAAGLACPAGERPGWPWCWRLPLSLCCPDDYCAKPRPCLPPGYCPRGCDDYHGKPPPCLPPGFCPKGCDDYCAKPRPCLPCDLPWMKCYPTEAFGAERPQTPGGCCPPAKPWRP